MWGDDQSVPDPGKVIEGEQEADSRLSVPAVLDLDLAKVVFAEEKATTGRRRHGHDIAFTLGDQTGQRRIVLENKVHFPLQTAGKALTSAAERRAFRAYMVEDAVGKGEEKVCHLVHYSRH